MVVPMAVLVPQPPPGIDVLFADRREETVEYAALLADEGVRRGLLGPREVPRLWDRHIMNCAAIAELCPRDVDLWDVGSGAGLPGIVVALARPDVRVTLLEPLLRRVEFLDEVVARLSLENVTVIRGRAEEWHSRVQVDMVTARAVAPLERLAGWCLPLLHPGGQLVALKGVSADDELTAAVPALRALGARSWDVEHVGFRDAIATVIRVVAGESSGPVGKQGGKARGHGRRGSRGR
jgi:16S rRNA (guanine527-N7)-methyltransferase